MFVTVNSSPPAEALSFDLRVVLRGVVAAGAGAGAAGGEGGAIGKREAGVRAVAGLECATSHRLKASCATPHMPVDRLRNADAGVLGVDGCEPPPTLRPESLAEGFAEPPLTSASRWRGEVGKLASPWWLQESRRS